MCPIITEFEIVNLMVYLPSENLENSVILLALVLIKCIFQYLLIFFNTHDKIFVLPKNIFFLYFIQRFISSN